MPSFYKYRRFDLNGVGSDLGIQNLFSCTAWLSSRKKFNDPFDSHVNYVFPTSNSIRRLLNRLAGAPKLEAESWIHNDELSGDIKRLWISLIAEYDKLIDRYALYCFASSPVNAIMWAHYAADHTGYCIEFDSANFEATKVNYSSKLFEIDSNEVLKVYFNLAGSETGKLIHRGLTTKLLGWKVESEFRYINLGTMEEGTSGISKSYPQTSVKSVIFGANINSDHREYLIKNIPYKVQFKHARIDRRNSCVIVESSAT